MAIAVNSNGVKVPQLGYGVYQVTTLMFFYFKLSGEDMTAVAAIDKYQGQKELVKEMFMMSKKVLILSGKSPK